MKANRICTWISILLILTACGGGGGGSSSPPIAQTGVFIDAAVEGITYRTATQSGTTDSAGSFNYLPEETVSFYIGDILVGSASATPLLTPIELVPDAVDETDTQVTNILRFIQSLDSDRDPDNGISIPASVTAQAVGQSLDFSLASPDFEIAANALLSMLTSGQVTSLVDAGAAQAHFVGSLGGDPPANKPPLAFDDDYSTPEDTPLVVSPADGVLGNDKSQQKAYWRMIPTWISILCEFF